MLSLVLVTPKMLPFTVAMICLVAIIDAASIAVGTDTAAAAAEKSDAVLSSAEVNQLAGMMEKRFYSWEEGKRSVNLDDDEAVAMHWKRPVYSFAGGNSGGRSFVAAPAPPISSQVVSGGGAGGHFHQFSHPSLYFVRQPLFLH